jgi:hypothetical protein
MDRTVYIPQSTNSHFLDAEASQLRDPVTFTRDDHNACKLRKNPSFVLRRLDHDSGVLLAACCGAQLRKRPRKDDLRICGSHSLPILIQSPSKSLSKSPLGTQLGSTPTICGMEENRAVLDHPTRMSVRSRPCQTLYYRAATMMLDCTQKPPSSAEYSDTLSNERCSSS